MSTTSERRSANRRTEDIYRKAIEDIRDYAIFMTDPDGMITNWNIGAQHILGYTEEEAVGINAARFFTPEDRAKEVPQGVGNCRRPRPGRGRALAHAARRIAFLGQWCDDACPRW